LALSGATIEGFGGAVLFDLCDVSADRAPASDLAFVVDAPPAGVIAAVPLKPAAGIFVIDPTVPAPDREWLRGIDPKKIQRRIVTFGTKLRSLEPISGKLIAAVGHVPPAENAEGKHLFWCQLRLESG
jgi:hypothetical protein